VQLAQALLQALHRAGAREIFGIPGDFALPLFEVIERSDELPLYTLSHEPAVGFAADAATRFGGGIGVAAITYGAGAFNLVNSVAGAYAERSPVVVLSGAPGRAERSRGLLVHHQARTLESQLNVYREITCDQAVLDDPGTAPESIARVLRSCRERSQPVYLEIPRDMVAVEVEPVPDLAPSPVDPDAVEAAATEVLARLAAARSPVLMVDAEVRRYGIEAKVAELATRLEIPVVTTFMGRGLLADAPNPPMGTYIGVAGQPEITELVESSDALFLLGVILSDTNFVDAMTAQAMPLGASLSLPDPPAPPYGLVADDASVTPTDIATAINDMMHTHGPLPWPRTWATACSRPWTSTTTPSRPRATTPVWGSACQPDWACRSRPESGP